MDINAIRAKLDALNNNNRQQDKTDYSTIFWKPELGKQTVRLVPSAFDPTFPFKELRNIIDEGKKDIKSGIVVGISTFEDKVGLAVGVTKDLISKYDAVDLVKAASVILGGKGGGGRKDFAQAGGVDKDKIKEAFKEISKKIS